MQSLQRLQPEIKALQAKYKDDKQRLNQEMMGFYRENKVNPFGSCLPLVAQFPVFIALFYLLRQDLKQHICAPVMKAAAKLATPPLATPGAVGQLPPNGAFPVHYANGHSCSQAAHAVGGSGNAGFLMIPDITAKATGAVLITLIVLYIGLNITDINTGRANPSYAFNIIAQLFKWDFSIMTPQDEFETFRDTAWWKMVETI